MARQDFEGQESQGGIRDFEFTVTDAYFASSEKYNEAVGGDADILFLHLLGTTDLEAFPTLGATDFHPSYKVGGDWTTVDGGKTVTYSGRSKKPKMGGGPAGYGGFCTRVLEVVPEGTPGDPMENGHPSDASIWVGTKWYMEEVTTNAGTQYEKAALMPTQFLGTVDGAAPPVTPTGGNVGVVAAAPSSNGLRDQVIEIARESETYQAFQAKALQLPNVSANPDLIKEILDQSGIYAQARG